MSDTAKMTIEISKDAKAVILKFAEGKGCTPDEGVESLVRTAVGRLNAVRTYAKKKAAEKPVKIKKEKTKKGEKTEKAKGPKGPLARKAK